MDGSTIPLAGKSLHIILLRSAKPRLGDLLSYSRFNFHIIPYKVKSYTIQGSCVGCFRRSRYLESGHTTSRGCSDITDANETSQDRFLRLSDTGPYYRFSTAQFIVEIDRGASVGPSNSLGSPRLKWCMGDLFLLCRTQDCRLSCHASSVDKHAHTLGGISCQLFRKRGCFFDDIQRPIGSHFWYTSTTRSLIYPETVLLCSTT